MLKNPKISIIVVNYNGETFIENCVDSLLKSKYKTFEIIVVDNGSTDASSRILKNRYKADRRVQLYLKKNNDHFTGGSNYGAKKATGDKLIFINSDTEVQPDWIQKLVSCGKNNPLSLIQPKIFVYGEKNVLDSVGGNYSFHGFGYGMGGREVDVGQYKKRMKVDFVNGTCFMIDRQFFMKLGMFDDWFKHHYEDVDLCLRARKLGGNCFFCPNSIIYHKVSLSFKKSVRSNDFTYNVRKNKLRVIIKNFSGIERFLRMTLLLSIYALSIMQDLFRFQTKKISVTINSTFAAFNEKNI